jgi:Icc protein
VPSTPIRLVQFTDLHLYADAGRTLRGTPTLATFEAALAEARRTVAPWHALLLTGDLVQDDPAGYGQVRRLLGDSPGSIYCLPGNHDSATAMHEALGTAPFQVGGHALLGDWIVVMLDSSVPGAAAGRLRRPELARLDAALAAHGDRQALVCVHHHPVPMGSRWLDELPLENADALFGVLDRHARVRAVVFGHVHQAFDATRGSVRLLGTPSTCVQFRPKADEFELDTLPPAFRWLDLHADGRIDTGLGWVPAADA